MKLRTILFGYEMKNGQMAVVDSEAAVVRNIFALYILMRICLSASAFFNVARLQRIKNEAGLRQ